MPTINEISATTQPILTLIAPDSSLGDAARPRGFIYKQGDGNIGIHDWFYGATAAGVVMQSEILLINRDKKEIVYYLIKMEVSASPW